MREPSAEIAPRADGPFAEHGADRRRVAVGQDADLVEPAGGPLIEAAVVFGVGGEADFGGRPGVTAAGEDDVAEVFGGAPEVGAAEVRGGQWPSSPKGRNGSA